MPIKHMRTCSAWYYIKINPSQSVITAKATSINSRIYERKKVMMKYATDTNLMLQLEA